MKSAAGPAILLAAVTPAPQVMVVRAIKKISRNRSVKQILNSQGLASAGQLPKPRIRRIGRLWKVVERHSPTTLGL